MKLYQESKKISNALNIYLFLKLIILISILIKLALSCNESIVVLDINGFLKIILKLVLEIIGDKITELLV